jgi:hypothetical protein
MIQVALKKPCYKVQYDLHHYYKQIFWSSLIHSISTVAPLSIVRAKIREWMPGAGRVSTHPGLHADVG